MLKKHIEQKLLSGFEYTPTPSQEKLIQGLASFITSADQNSVLLIKGFAGTGKTSVMKAFTSVLKEFSVPFRLMAPTGRAAKVLSGFTGFPAYTVHRVIYRQKSAGNINSRFDLNFNKLNNGIFIVDEASMIANYSFENSTFGSGNLLSDLLQFVFENANGSKLIIIGDTAQLPPVGLENSPALNREELETAGLNVTEYFLSDIVRQASDSGILFNATKLRNQLCEDNNSNELPVFRTNGFNDIKRLNGGELIEELSYCYDKYGIDDTIVICRSNKRANLYNKGIRGSVLFREEEVTTGDLLMIVKNNYFWMKDYKEIEFIANGDIAEIVRISGYEELYNKRFANVTLRLIDYGEIEFDAKIILNTLDSETAGMTKQEQEKFYSTVMEDYSDIPTAKKRYEALRENPYFNALQVKFAYALTTHKAQGGQWKIVFIDQGYIPEEQTDRSYLRWLYTGFTRATERLYLVNFKDEMFG
ncbi:MAG: AAA family ATPase [Chlorobi bacterium]|nr:AAA family ATPase [Chlorobiota bacterium]